MRKYGLSLLILASTITRPTQAATFIISYNGATAEAQTAIEHAADIWGGLLVSEVPIKVLVYWAPVGGSTLGITFPNGRRDFPGAPLTETWYATSLANSIAGTELNVGENDFEIFFNSSMNWYFGLDGDPPNGEYDLVSAALHEIGHGLGFVGLSKVEGNQGSFGLLEMADFSPLFTTFPWPELDTLPGVFDRFLTDQQDGLLSAMDNPSEILGDAQTGNQLYFNGPLAMSANGGNMPRIYAPATFALGSSCVHLNETSYPTGNANELMTPFSSAGTASHWPGPLCLAMLEDIGWILAPPPGFEEIWSSVRSLIVHPNPVVDVLHLNTTAIRGRIELSILDQHGRTVLKSPTASGVDVSALPAGSYGIVLRTATIVERGHFIKL